MRTCQCGGVIREQQKPYWDTLPSCTCQNPIAVTNQTITTTAGTTLTDTTLKEAIDYLNQESKDE